LFTWVVNLSNHLYLRARPACAAADSWLLHLAICRKGKAEKLRPTAPQEYQLVALTPTNASVPNASSMISTAPVEENKEQSRSGKGVMLYPSM